MLYGGAGAIVGHEFTHGFDNVRDGIHIFFFSPSVHIVATVHLRLARATESIAAFACSRVVDKRKITCILYVSLLRHVHVCRRLDVTLTRMGG